jgi:hypothetical protein
MRKPPKTLWRAFLFFVASVTAIIPVFANSKDVPSCPPVPSGDSAPWNHISRALDSFPPDSPRPVVVGDFQDRAENYRLKLWKDKDGYFGEISHPVLPADSPTSRLYDVAWDERTKILSFRAQLLDEMSASGAVPFEARLSGTLTKERYEAEATGSRSEKVTLRRRNWDHFQWVSRAQFECAMNLWHRF